MAGRPKGEQVRDEVIKIRVTKAGKERVEALAAPQNVSDYTRDLWAADARRRG